MTRAGRRPGEGRGVDDGTAVIEFVLLAVVLVVPFVYAMLCLFEVQRAAYAMSSAAREAGRAFVTAPSGASADARGRAAVELALDDDGGLARIDRVAFVCTASPCLKPGAQVRVELATSVPLPLVPHWGGGAPAAVRVEATHVEVVDRYRETRP